MSKTKIEWTDETWNVTGGCTPVSAGCANCAAARSARRCNGFGNDKYKGLVEGSKWTGEIRLYPKELKKPLHWRLPRLVFVDFMSDLFHPDVPFEFVDKVFAVMALCPDHTFQVLTKRPERMAEYLSTRVPDHPSCDDELISEAYYTMLNINGPQPLAMETMLPLPNVCLGTTAENQEQADIRVPHLLKCPAAKRFVSVEPMLSAVDVGKWLPNFLRCSTASSGMCAWTGPFDGAATKVNEYGDDEEICGLCGDWAVSNPTDDEGEIDWVICGGESGPGARPMHPDWARSMRDQCKAAGIPFFFKQWGEWQYLGQHECHRAWETNHIMAKKGDYGIDGQGHYLGVDDGRRLMCDNLAMEKLNYPISMFRRVGKKKAGSLLDGAEYKEMPE